MSIFRNPLEEMALFQELREDMEKGRGPVEVTGCVESQKAHLIAELGSIASWHLLVCADEVKARELMEDLRCFGTEAWLYPARDLLFYHADIHGNLLTRERIRVLRHLAEDRGGTVITTAGALLEHLLPMEKLLDQVITIRMDSTVNTDDLSRRLTLRGYEKVGEVEGSGQFSVRGGIVDIFPLTAELPYRIELWGDEVDSIRTFDPESQRSVEQVEEAVIYPATELPLSREEVLEGLERMDKDRKRLTKKFRDRMQTEAAYRLDSSVKEFSEELREGMEVHGLSGYIRYFAGDTVSFLQYFPEDTLIFTDQPVQVKEKLEELENEFRLSMEGRLEDGYILPGEAEVLRTAKEAQAGLFGARSVLLSGLGQRIPGVTISHTYPMTVRNVNAYQASFDLLIGDLKKWKKEKYRVVLLTASRFRASRLAADLRDYELSAFCPDEGQDTLLPGQILVTAGSLHRGFEYPLIRFVVITEGEMFGPGRKKKKRKKTEYQGKAIHNFNELTVGDYVVHETHGLGIYRGIEQIEDEGTAKDFIKVEYAGGGSLFVPATALDRLQKYAGADAKAPKLSRLGGQEWKRTKTKVKKAVQILARDMVKLYARRSRDNGFTFSPDTEWQKEFEEAFPFEETEDQAAAIADTKADMESRKIMDRLICGDVGYGKTEIALRAAFKAIQDGKQVAFLVPTTILAQQHYNTFIQRMKDFPVRVDMLSRFRTAAQQKKTLDDLRKGMVDIVIGTHRLLSADVSFKDLGLLVIDEEQRFGVTHKDKIKKLRENVDVLTLTATPIPRTLHMSMVGIRDMSVLEEPPVDRLPIQTYVMEYSEEMVREAIRRELARHGQVYYVYNRVNSIAEAAARVQQLVPEANVVFAHGQMKERELEAIMMDFVNGEIDVLVSTTIIETGLDIPNANTIIIHDADRLGLSQLYQIRGRVGRSARTSYAFLLYRRDKLLKEVAEKRLSAIREFTELGSGIKIAMRDLEIRGAGNVLGAEQHGHMEAVGYDLYCKLLNEAVLALKGIGDPVDEFDTEVKCGVDAYIPPFYIPSETQKLDVYKKISAIEHLEDYTDMQDELTDRFGEMPKPVENLLLISLVRALGHLADAVEIRADKQNVSILMRKDARLQVERIPELCAAFPGLKLKTGQDPAFIYQDRTGKNFDALPMLRKARDILEKMDTMMEPAEKTISGEKR